MAMQACTQPRASACAAQEDASARPASTMRACQGRRGTGRRLHSGAARLLPGAQQTRLASSGAATEQRRAGATPSGLHCGAARLLPGAQHTRLATSGAVTQEVWAVRGAAGARVVLLTAGRARSPAGSSHSVRGRQAASGVHVAV
jgi:hypothetical protein